MGCTVAGAVTEMNSAERVHHWGCRWQHPELLPSSGNYIWGCLGLVLALAQHLSTLDPESGRVALSVRHVEGYVFGPIADSPQIAKAGSILFTDNKQYRFGKRERWGKAETLQCLILAGSPPCKKSHQRRSSSAVCLPSSALLANASECEAHAVLVRSGWACKAGASFALPGSRSSKLGQAQECKLKAHSWELSLPLSWTALVEKHWEENQGLGRGWHLTNWEHMHGLCEQACTLYGHEMLLLNGGQEPSVLMWEHNLVVQGQTTKADRSDVDLERKQHQKTPLNSILRLAGLESLVEKLPVLSPVLYLLVHSRSEEVCIFVILQYLPLCKCC